MFEKMENCADVADAMLLTLVHRQKQDKTERTMKIEGKLC